MLASWFHRRRLRRSLTRILDAHAAAGTFTGAVLVEQGGEVLLRTARGAADRARGERSSPATPFRIGSTAKVFTALAVLRLCDAGRLSLDDSVTRFVPGLPDGEALRVRHLLSNTSGIPEFLMLPVVQARAQQPHAVADVIALFRDLPRLFAPDERLSYSNSNWTLLVAIIERVTGLPFAVALEDLVLRPLGTTGTFVDVEGRTRAQGYSLVDEQLQSVPPLHASIELGAGGLCSTVDDLLRLDRALRTPGLLRAETLAAQRRVVARDGDFGYGYGLCLGHRFGGAVSGHAGGTFGFTAFWNHYDVADACVVVLANVDNGSADALERNLGAAVCGAPVELPAARRFVQVAGDVLDRYLGTYRSEFAGRAIDFSVERKGDELVADFPLLPRAPLRPLTERRFFTRLKGTDVLFEFAIEKDVAHASGIDVDWGGTPLHWPRVALR